MPDYHLDITILLTPILLVLNIQETLWDTNPAKVKKTFRKTMISLAVPIALFHTLYIGIEWHIHFMQKWLSDLYYGYHKKNRCKEG